MSRDSFHITLAGVDAVEQGEARAPGVLRAFRCAERLSLTRRNVEGGYRAPPQDPALVSGFFVVYLFFWLVDKGKCAEKVHVL